MKTFFTVAQNGDKYEIILTVISKQVVIDTANTAAEAAEKAVALNRIFWAARNGKQEIIEKKKTIKRSKKDERRI